MKNSTQTEERQFEFGSDQEVGFGATNSADHSDEDIAQRLDKITSDTISSVRPYLNRMVRDVERLLEGDYIRTLSSSVLEDMMEGLEGEIRKFVQEVRALKKWSRPHPPESSSKHLR